MLEKDCVSMDEQVTVSVKADHSNFNLSISKLQCKLVRIISFNATFKRPESKVISFVLWTGGLGEIKKGTKDEDFRNLPIKIQDIVDESAPKGFSGGMSEYAGRVQQSVSGKMVTVRYAIEIHPTYSGCECGKNVSMTFPIEILAPEKVVAFVPNMVEMDQAPAEQPKDSDSDSS